MYMDDIKLFAKKSKRIGNTNTGKFSRVKKP